MVVSSNFTCSECDASFNTVAALCTHNFRNHGYRNPARYFISDNNACPVCNRVFQHRDLAFKHLAYDSKRCLALAQTIFNPMPHAQVVELDLQAVLIRKRIDTSQQPYVPPFRTHGPFVSHCLAEVRGGLRTYG